MSQQTATVRVEGDEVTIIRDYDAPRELVFAAFFDAEQLSKFWGPPGMSTPVESIVIEAHPGGRFETTMVNDETGEQYPNGGTFIEIVEPERFSWKEDMGIVTTSTLEDLGGGRTRVTIHQVGVPEMFRSDEALNGFVASLDRFAAHLAAIQA